MLWECVCRCVVAPWCVCVCPQVEFWTELASTVPSAAKLHTLGRAVEEMIEHADKTFQKLLSLNPNSVKSLRRYSSFMSEVSNNPAKAAKLQVRALIPLMLLSLFLLEYTCTLPPSLIPPILLSLTLKARVMKHIPTPPPCHARRQRMT